MVKLYTHTAYLKPEAVHEMYQTSGILKHTHPFTKNQKEERYVEKTLHWLEQEFVVNNPHNSNYYVLRAGILRKHIRDELTGTALGGKSPPSDLTSRIMESVLARLEENNPRQIREMFLQRSSRGAPRRNSRTFIIPLDDEPQRGGRSHR